MDILNGECGDLLMNDKLMGMDVCFMRRVKELLELGGEILLTRSFSLLILKANYDARMSLIL